MPFVCTVTGCDSGNPKKVKNKALRLHCFPKDPALADLWAEALPRVDGKKYKVCPSARVCSLHFLASDYRLTVPPKSSTANKEFWFPRLKKTAVPSQFPDISNLIAQAEAKKKAKESEVQQAKTDNVIAKDKDEESNSDGDNDEVEAKAVKFKEAYDRSNSIQDLKKKVEDNFHIVDFFQRLTNDDYQLFNVETIRGQPVIALSLCIRSDMSVSGFIRGVKVSDSHFRTAAKLGKVTSYKMIPNLLSTLKLLSLQPTE